ncbi:hypothetical protein Csa_023624, partial [Cucumis sativus]
MGRSSVHLAWYRSSILRNVLIITGSWSNPKFPTLKTRDEALTHNNFGWANSSSGSHRHAGVLTEGSDQGL